MGLLNVEVNLNLLEDLLRFDQGYRIERVFASEPDWMAPRSIRMIVSGPDLPHVNGGERIPMGELVVGGDGEGGVVSQFRTRS